MQIKTCNKCNQTKPIIDFHKSKDNKYGVRALCKSCIKKHRQNHYINNQERLKLNSSNYRLNNKDKIKHYNFKYYENNKNIIIYNKVKHNYNKYNSDSDFKLLCNLRSRLNYALNGNTKSKQTIELIGCSLDELKIHLQQTAIQNGYLDFDINNYSGQDYHIDHIKPCASFDLSDPKEQTKCFHYTNMQILTAKENLVKSNN